MKKVPPSSYRGAPGIIELPDPQKFISSVPPHIFAGLSKYHRSVVRKKRTRVPL